MSDERPDKQEIIRRLQIEARRLGKTPSMKEFFENPNVDVSKGDVFHHWPRWNDAVKEACLGPNEQTRKRPLSDIASHYLEAVRHHGKVPTRNELRIYIRERKDDGTAYSGQRAFENLGMSTIGMVRSALDHATSSNKWDDVIPILEKYLSKNAGGAEIQDTTDPALDLYTW